MDTSYLVLALMVAAFLAYVYALSRRDTSPSQAEPDVAAPSANISASMSAGRNTGMRVTRAQREIGLCAAVSGLLLAIPSLTGVGLEAGFVLSMMAVIVISFLYGFKAGMGAGLLGGLICILLSPPFYALIEEILSSRAWDQAIQLISIVAVLAAVGLAGTLSSTVRAAHQQQRIWMRSGSIVVGTAIGTLAAWCVYALLDTGLPRSIAELVNRMSNVASVFLLVFFVSAIFCVTVIPMLMGTSERRES